MKPLNLGQPLSQKPEDVMAWLVNSVREIERSSKQDPAAIADSYTSTGTTTATRNLNVSAPTTANVVAVLATFLQDNRNRGVNRVAPT